MEKQIKALNTLLATFEVAATNVKARHWYVSGTHFSSVHLLLDDIWKTLLDAADVAAETVRVLGGKILVGDEAFMARSIVEADTRGRDAAELLMRATQTELLTIISHIHAGVAVKVFDPTTENDLLNVTSKLRHHLLFLDGFLSDWPADDGTVWS